MNKFLILLGLFVLCQACGHVTSQPKEKIISTENTQVLLTQIINPTGKTVISRFNTLNNYQRISTDSSSFGVYLRHIPLKPHGSLVSYYDGKTKPNNNIYDAVIDLPIGKRDLHQCADAVMRLRADYLFQSKKFDSIHFNFTNGFRVDYTNWRKGKRIIVKGNQVSWKQSAQPSDSPQDLWKYLEMIFSYAGTASLEKEMKSVPVEEMRIGDVFIKGGFPGHAVIVVDMAMNENTKENIFLLAQSYMPAQELQILKNPNNKGLSPWYGVSEISNELHTPEWTFKKSDLKRFSN